MAQKASVSKLKDFTACGEQRLANRNDFIYIQLARDIKIFLKSVSYVTQHFTSSQFCVSL